MGCIPENEAPNFTGIDTGNDFCQPFISLLSESSAFKMFYFILFAVSSFSWYQTCRRCIQHFLCSIPSFEYLYNYYDHANLSDGLGELSQWSFLFSRARSRTRTGWSFLECGLVVRCFSPRPFSLLKFIYIRTIQLITGSVTICWRVSDKLQISHMWHISPHFRIWRFSVIVLKSWSFSSALLPTLLIHPMHFQQLGLKLLLDASKLKLGIIGVLV